MKLKNKPLPFVERLQRNTRKSKELFAAFVKERREVLLLMDAAKIKAFLNKYGEQEVTRVDDEPFLAGCCYHIIADEGIAEQDKQQARWWLASHSWFLDADGELRKR